MMADVNNNKLESTLVCYAATKMDNKVFPGPCNTLFVHLVCCMRSDHVFEVLGNTSVKFLS